MAQIRINYTFNRIRAQRIASAARDLGKQIQNLDELINDAKKHYKGDAASAFIKSCEALRADMLTARKQMSNLCDLVLEMINRIKKLDEAQAKRSSILGG